MGSTMICPKCQAVNPAGAQYCKECSLPLRGAAPVLQPATGPAPADAALGGPGGSTPQTWGQPAPPASATPAGPGPPPATPTAGWPGAPDWPPGPGVALPPIPPVPPRAAPDPVPGGVPPPPPARPAARTGPPFMLIAATLLALGLFLGVGLTVTLLARQAERPTPAPAPTATGLALVLTAAPPAGGASGTPTLPPQATVPGVAAPTNTLAAAAPTDTLAAAAPTDTAAAGGAPTDTPSGLAIDPLAPITYSGPRRPNGDMQANHVNSPPTIDGNLDDWAGATHWPARYGVTNPPLTAAGGPADLSADFLFAYDDANFYFAATITDNVHVHSAKTRDYTMWQGDDIELWFDTDLAGDFAAAKGDADDYQMGFSAGDFAGLTPQAVFFLPSQQNALQQGVQLAALPRPDGQGYTLEAAIPWTLLGTGPQPGAAIGFCANAGDVDTPGSTQQQHMVSTCNGWRWNAPPTFGNLFW